MSRVDNTSPKAGDAVTAAGLNEKFTDIQTATTAGLDEANFRSEALDYTKFPVNNAHGKTGIVLRDWKYANNGVGTSGGATYTSTTIAGAPAELSHGAGSRLVWPLGQELAANDMLRAHFWLWADAVGIDESKYKVAYGNASGNPYAALVGIDETDIPVWVAWLQWDITSNALANWTEVPGQGDFDSNFSSAGNGSYCDEMLATAVIPHGSRYAFSGQTYLLKHTDLPVRRSYNYVNDTGSPITIYGLRLVINGLFHPVCSSFTSNKNALTKKISAPTWDGETIEINGVTLGALVQRTT